MKDKYIGKTYEGRWEVISFNYYNNSHSKKYILRNKFNNEEMELKYSVLYKIEKNVYKLSDIRKRRAKKTSKNCKNDIGKTPYHKWILSIIEKE